MRSEIIAMADCVDRGIYLLRSRNLVIGVWNAEQRGFAGVRQKFDSRYIFIEYHVETGAPYGTAAPLGYLGQIPDGLEAVEGWWTEKDGEKSYRSNKALLDHLDLTDRAVNLDQYLRS